MAVCLAANVNLLFLPAHTSHGIQPLDNGIIAAEKAAWEKEAEKLSALMDGSPLGKLNFTKCLYAARNAVSPRTIRNASKHTGCWPINRQEALHHDEIQADTPANAPIADLEQSGSESGCEDAPVTRDFIMGLLVPRDDRDKRAAAKRVADSWTDLTTENALLKTQLASYQGKEEQRNKTQKKRKVPNPTDGFEMMADIVAKGGTIETLEREPQRAPKRQKRAPAAVVEESSGESSSSEEEDAEECDGTAI